MIKQLLCVLLLCCTSMIWGQKILLEAEFFWGTSDPGQGNGFALSVEDGAFDEALETVFQNNATLPPSGGLNLFNIRVKNAQNTWGPLYKRTIYIYDNNTAVRELKLTAAEYFWGTSDPGQGNANALLAFDGAYDEALETVFENSAALPPSGGLNLFNIRVRGEDNVWGPLYKRTIYIYDNTATARELKITAAEYFWGTSDPGQGNGNTLLAFDSDYDEALESVFENGATLPASGGLNLFNIRVRGEDNLWGPLFKRTIYIYDNTATSRDLKVTAAEYFWGSDPGQGNGTPLLAFDDALDDAIETVFDNNANLPSTGGLNLFNIRVRGEDNVWGPVYKRTVYIYDNTATSRDLKLTAGEFFWGTSDPGQGNGIQILASDGNFDEALEDLFSSSVFSPGPGINLFNIRVRGEDNVWGPLYRRTIDVQLPVNDLQIVNLSGSDTICRGDTIVLQAYGGMNMLWYSDDLNGDTSPTLTLVPDSSMQLMLTGYNPYEGNDTAYIDISVGQHVAVNINLDTDSLIFCGVDSVLLDAGPGYDIYGWSPWQFTTGKTCLPFTFTGGINAQSIYAQESGTYYVQVTDSLNCSSMDSIVVSLLTPTFVGPTSIFEGDTVSLVASIDGVGFLLESYDTVFVNPSQSVQLALDTAESGTVILLESGTYTENIVWPQTDHLILSSMDGPEQTIIDGSAANESVIYIGNGQIGAVVDKLQITKGYGSVPTFNSNTFGGGILIDENVRAVIKNCLIIENALSNSNIYAGGVFISFSSEVYCVNNTIANNNGEAIWWRSSEYACDDDALAGPLTGRDGALLNNIFYSNNSYGLYNQSGAITNSYSIRFNNSFDNSGQYPEMSNWYNGSGVSSYTETGFNGNISENPLFVDASNGNYQLSSGSPSEASGENGATMGYEGDFDLSNLVYSPETITYNWSTGDSSQNITIAPTESTTYGIDVGSGSNFCSESITVVVFPHLKDSICANELYDFNGTSISDAGVYIDTLSDFSGQDSLVKLTLTVLDIPDVLAGDDTLICQNDGMVLSASGSTIESYIWNNNISDGLEFYPAVGSLDYTVSATDSLGCSNTDTTTVVVSALPNVDAGSNQTICDGEQLVLNGSGAYTYAWSAGVADGVPFIPAVGSQVYAVSGTDTNGCVNTDNVLIEVNGYVNSEFTQVEPQCFGNSVQLPTTSNNGFSGTWSPVFNSNSTTNYTFNTNPGQCGNAAQMTVQINPLPNVNAGSNQQLCEGASTFVNATGAINYQWNNGITNGVSFIPQVGSTVYTVVGTDANGCSNSDQLIVLVNELPFVYAGADQQLCEGNTVILSANGTGPFTWSGGIINGVPFIPNIGVSNYTVNVTDNNGCTNSDQLVLTVYENPEVNAGTDQVICEGESVVLSAIGANSYDWSDDIENGIAFQPTPGIYQYSVIGYNQFACSDQDMVQVIVHPIVYGVDEQEACDYYIWIDGNQYTESNNSATWTLNNVNGCDSIVTLDLSMNYESDTVLYVSSLGTYKLNGYSYTEAGVYQQDTLTEFGCDSTIIINLNIDDSGVESLSEYGISVYPNPFWSELTLLLEKPDPDIYVLLIDINGRKIFELNSLSIKNNFELSFLESGVYYLNIHQKDSILGRIKVVRR